MKLIHISDTHGAKNHEKLLFNESDAVDVIIHSGDIGGRTNLLELQQFLEWFEKLPAKKKIFIAGNHDIVLDKKWVQSEKKKGNIEGLLAQQYYHDAMELIQNYDIKYLCNTDYVYEGIKFYGSPYSPSFHKQNWVFNADRGKEICKQWTKIPSNTNVLITHTPCYRIADLVDDRYLKANEDKNVGCKDLYNVIQNRLFGLKLHCFGHIHDNYSIQLKQVSNKRKVLFSNGAVLNNDYELLITKPLIINL